MKVVFTGKIDRFEWKRIDNCQNMKRKKGNIDTYINQT